MKAYAIKDPKGKIFPFSACYGKGRCQRHYSAEYSNYEWKTLHKMGYRCVPVEITEITSVTLNFGEPLDGEPLKALHETIKKSDKKVLTLKNRR